MHICHEYLKLPWVFRANTLLDAQQTRKSYSLGNELM